MKRQPFWMRVILSLLLAATLYIMMIIAPVVLVYVASRSPAIKSLATAYLGVDPVPVPNLEIPTHELLLSSEAFPAHWDANVCADSCLRNGISSLSWYDPLIGGRVVQDVFHYHTETDAHAKFVRYEETDVTEWTSEKPRFRTPFRRPAGFTYYSSIADEQYLSCGVDTGPECAAGFRYGNYFVFFYIQMTTVSVDEVEYTSEGGLTLIEVETMFSALDQLVSEKLGIPLSTGAEGTP